MKDRAQCYSSMYCDQYGHLRTYQIYNAGKTLYMDRSRVVELLLQFEKKPNKLCQIMW